LDGCLSAFGIRLIFVDDVWVLLFGNFVSNERFFRFERGIEFEFAASLALSTSGELG
jgi:hypothetical protein